MFELSLDETANLMSQIATSSSRHGERRKHALVFTEHGALMAATVLNSARAIEVGLYVVRAFVRLRETVAQHRGLAGKLSALEGRLEDLSVKHDVLASRTRAEMKQVFAALRELLNPRESPSKRRIGFVTDGGKGDE